MEKTDKFQGSSETPVQPQRPPSYDPETAQADAEAEVAARAAQESRSQLPPKREPVTEARQAAPAAKVDAGPRAAVAALSSARTDQQAQTRKPMAAARIATTSKTGSDLPAAQAKTGANRDLQAIGAPKTAAASVTTRAETRKVAPVEAKTEQQLTPTAPEANAAQAAATPVVTTEPTGQPSSLRADEVRLLQTRGLVKIYDGRAVVKEVDIHVRPTEIVGLLGPNGAGKTTTFYMIVGLVPPNGGRVFFDNEDVTNDPMYRRARKGMGYLPQEESIFRKLTVEQNIMAVMETLNISRSERQDRCHALMKQFGIEHIGKNLALTCSGGEKRRLTIARSLVTQPKLLMLDEPFSGVDPIAVSEIQDIIVGLREAGLAILITDHNVRETLNIVDRACLIFEGEVLREGTRDFLINDPISRELYLGDRFSM